jgi:hypothetical protein
MVLNTEGLLLFCPLFDAGCKMRLCGAAALELRRQLPREAKAETAADVGVLYTRNTLIETQQHPS